MMKACIRTLLLAHLLFCAGLASAAETTTGTASVQPPRRKFATVAIGNPHAIAVDAAGTVYVHDVDTGKIYRITPAGEAAAVGGASGPVAAFGALRSLAAAADGTVYVADTDNHLIRKIAPDGVVTALAGKAGEAGKADGKGNSARFNGPRGIAVDGAGNIYVADAGNGAVRRIAPDGTVTTIAGAAPPSADRAAQVDAIREATFRHIIQANLPKPSALQRKSMTYYLALGDTAAPENDPSDAFMARFSDHFPRVAKGSEARVSKAAGVRDIKTGERGLLLKIWELRWISDDAVEVDGGYYGGVLSGAGSTIYLKRVEGTWTVERSVLLWIA